MSHFIPPDHILCHMRSRATRVLLAALLVALAAAAGLSAWGVLSNLWADYQDSATSTYLLIGLPLLAFSGAALFSAVTVLRRG
jgi:hypothetical protein